MKYRELSKERQLGVATALLEFTYPLYFATGVSDYDYYPNGSCFSFRKDNRLFFIFTEHQLINADGSDICVGYPGSQDRFIQIETSGVRRFKKSDLAIFEHGNLGEFETPLCSFGALHFQKVKNCSQFEYAVLGCQMERNFINYETKNIFVRKNSLITDFSHTRTGSDSFQLDLSCCQVAGIQENVPELGSFRALTQGLSGSPIVAFRIEDVSEHKSEIDFYLVGVATYVAEGEKRLNGTTTHELIACLEYGFNAFPEIRQLL